MEPQTQICRACTLPLPISRFGAKNKTCRKCTRAKSNAKIKALHPEKVMLNNIRDSAKKRGLDFNLTVEDMKVPTVCPLTGITIVRGRNKAAINSPSVDRIDNKKGYIKGNVWVVSLLANMLKGVLTLDELKDVAKQILAAQPQ